MKAPVAIAGLLLAALLAGNADAQSQPPSPSGGKLSSNQESHPEDTAKKPDSDLHDTKESLSGTREKPLIVGGAERMPLIVDVVKTTNDEQRADQESKDTHQSATDNGHLVWITGILAGFACLQWGAMLWQGILIRRQIINSRQEFVSTHRPRLRVRLVQMQKAIGGQPITVQYEVINVGDTKAETTLNEVTLNVPRGAGRGQEDVFDAKQVPNRVIAAGESILCAVKTAVTCDTQWAASNMWPHEAVNIHGTIKYIDDNGVKRRTGFNRICIGDGQRTRKIEDSEYEYED